MAVSSLHTSQKNHFGWEVVFEIFIIPLKGIQSYYTCKARLSVAAKAASLMASANVGCA